MLHCKCMYIYIYRYAQAYTHIHTYTVYTPIDICIRIDIHIYIYILHTIYSICLSLHLLRTVTKQTGLGRFRIDGFSGYLGDGLRSLEDPIIPR